MGLDFDMDDLVKELKKLDKEVSGPIIINALNEGGDKIKGALKAEIRTRVYDTGDLFESIDKTKIAVYPNATGYVDIGSISTDEEVRARNWYQEYGHSTMIGKKHNKRAAIKSFEKAKEAMAKSIIKDISK